MNARSIRLAFGAVFLLLWTGQPSFGQVLEDLRLFGYFQGRLLYSEEQGIPGPVKKTGFTLQQLNFLLGKDFNANFSAFANIEITNSFSSENGWGSLKLDEAWIRYHNSAALNIKAGLQIPPFNNLNEIKNRTPLLPYIMRPSVYEASLSTLLPSSVFVPQQAFVQIYGALPIQSARFDYAAYVGNQDAFITSTTVGSSIPGADTTMALLFGGRVGARYRSLKVGVSGTVDHENLSLLRLGTVPRYRIGIDLSFTLHRLFFEGEMISILHDPTSLQQAFINLIAEEQPYLDNNLDKFFIYVLLGYRFTDQWFVYVYHDYLKDNVNEVLSAGGYKAYSGGVGFKPIDSIALKAQYIRAYTNDDILQYRGHFLLGAISVLF